MIVSDVITRVTRQFGDEANVQIDNADIIRWINDSVRDFSVQNDLTQATGTINSVVDQNSYTFPADLLSMRSIYYDSQKLQFYKRTEYDEYINKVDPLEEQSGTPILYTRWGTEFLLYPKPDSIKQIKMRYLQRPTEVTVEGDTVPLPLEYHNRVVEYCLQQAYQTDEDWDASTQMSSQLSDGLTRLKEQETFQDKEFYPGITVLADDSGYPYGYN
jgi:hypothetical protein